MRRTIDAEFRRADDRDRAEHEAAPRETKDLPATLECASERSGRTDDAESDKDKNRQRRHDPPDDAERAPAGTHDEAGREVGVEHRGCNERRGGPERRLAEPLVRRERATQIHTVRLRGPSAGFARNRGYNSASCPLSSVGRAPPW